MRSFCAFAGLGVFARNEHHVSLKRRLVSRKAAKTRKDAKNLG